MCEHQAEEVSGSMSCWFTDTLMKIEVIAELMQQFKTTSVSAREGQLVFVMEVEVTNNLRQLVCQKCD